VRHAWPLLRARRVRSSALAATVLGVVGLVVSGLTVPVASLRSTDALELPLVTLLPLVGVVVVCLATREEAAEVERSCGRSTWLIRALPTLASAGLMVGGLGVLAIDPHGQALLVVRNFVGLAGLGLIAAPLVGSSAAAFLPVADVVVNTLLGEGPTGQIAPWAWTLRPATDPIGWWVAVVTATAGCTLFLAVGPRQRPEERLHN
jgi:hypothetical protein